MQQNCENAANAESQEAADDRERAGALLRRAMEIAPEDGLIIACYGTLRWIEEATAEAEELYERALKLSPEVAEVHARFAWFHTLEGMDWDRAEVHYERAVELAANDFSTLFRYARFLRHMKKDLDRAEAFYDRALVIDPADSEMLGEYALFQVQDRRNFDRAEELLNAAVANDPDNSSLLGNFAVFYRRERGDMDRAEEMYERAYQAQPDNILNLINYAWFLYTVRHNSDRSCELFERAGELGADSATFFGNFGQLLLGRNDFERGMGYINRASELNDGHPELDLEIAFCRYVYLDGQESQHALQEVRRMLSEGVRSPDWSLMPHVRLVVQKEGRVEEWLTDLASVIAGQADWEQLEKHVQWQTG